MPPILNAQGLTKAFGATALFREISFTVSDGDRTMLIEATADKLREFAAGLVAFTAVPETTRGEHQRIHVKGST